jgi:hypothetical protein
LKIKDFVSDVDMTPKNMTIEYKVSSFLYLHNDINKKMMISNVVTFSMLRNNDDDGVKLGKMLHMASTTNTTWIHHAQDRSWSASSSKPNIRIVGSSTILH